MKLPWKKIKIILRRNFYFKK